MFVNTFLYKGFHRVESTVQCSCLFSTVAYALYKRAFKYMDMK